MRLVWNCGGLKLCASEEVVFQVFQSVPLQDFKTLVSWEPVLSSRVNNNWEPVCSYFFLVVRLICRRRIIGEDSENP